MECQRVVTCFYQALFCLYPSAISVAESGYIAIDKNNVVILTGQSGLNGSPYLYGCEKKGVLWTLFHPSCSVT